MADTTPDLIETLDALLISLTGTRLKTERLMDTTPFNLRDYGITVAEVHRNLAPSRLDEHAIRYEKDAVFKGTPAFSQVVIAA